MTYAMPRIRLVAEHSAPVMPEAWIAQHVQVPMMPVGHRFRQFQFHAESA